MKLQNSYIFLKNKFNKDFQPKKDGNNTTTVLGRSVYGYIKHCLPNINKVDGYGNFYKTKYSGDIVCGKISGQVELIMTEVSGTTYLDIIVDCKTKAQAVKCLEEIQNKILSSGIREKYIDIISYDAISEYYCNKMYPELNELERNLRKLLFNTYIVNFGNKYYSTTIDIELQNKIKGVVSTDNKGNKNELKAAYKANNNDELKEIARLQNFFYSFEYTDIQTLLFTSGWNLLDEKKKNDFLESHDDLSELDDEELRRAFSDFVPRSDWERFFSEKIEISNIEELIDYIRIYRNTIAHFKFFNGSDYDDCKKKIRLLNTSIKDAIMITEEKDFMEKNAEALKASFGEIFAGFAAFNKLMNEKVQNVVHNVISPAMKALSKYAESRTWINQVGRFAINSTATEVLNRQQKLIQAAKPSFKVPEGMKHIAEASAAIQAANVKLPTLTELPLMSVRSIIDEETSCSSDDTDESEEE